MSDGDAPERSPVELKVALQWRGRLSTYESRRARREQKEFDDRRADERVMTMYDRVPKTVQPL